MNTEIAESKTQILAPFNMKELAEYMESTPEIYTDIKTRFDKAKSVVDDLMVRAMEGVDEELAEEIGSTIKKLRNTGDLFNKKRTPITQMFTAVSKSFTSIEADLKGMNVKLQTILNDYAAQQEAERKKKEAEAAKKAAAEKEKAELEAELERGVQTSFTNLLALKKTYLNSVLEDTDLTIISDSTNAIKNFSEVLPAKELKWPIISPSYTSEDDVKAIKKEIITKIMPGLKEEYTTEIASAKKETLDKMPSKRAELEEAKRLSDEAARQAKEAAEKEAKRQADIAAANAAQKKKLEAQAIKDREEEAKKAAELKAQQDALAAEQKKRKEEEDKRLADKAKEDAEKAAANAKAKSDAAAMNSDFEVMQAGSGVAVPKGKKVYVIEIKHQKAFTELFALWFSREGGDMMLDELERVTLGRIKTYFEKQATDNGEQIESKYFVYKESFKASIRR